MDKPVNRRWTIGRQVVAGYAAILLLAGLSIVIALIALGDLREAKDRVIQTDVRLVAGAHELQGVLGVRNGLVRSMIVDGDLSRADALREQDRAADDLLTLLDERAVTETGRRYLDQIDEELAVLRAEGERIIDQLGSASPEEIRQLVNDDLDPAFEQVMGTTQRLVTFQQERIAERMDDADDAADRAAFTVLAIGAIAIVVGIVLATVVVLRTNRRLTEMSLTVESASTQVVASATQQAAGAAEQATAVQETVATVEELTQAASQSADRARTVADTTRGAAEVAEEALATLDSSNQAMDDIRAQVEAIAETITALAGRAQAVSDIVGVVNEISDQTHLLALNASIEAARAGEHGRGFGVVAAEVRSLADQAKQATSRVAEILGEVQQGTTTAVMATEEGIKSVAAGVERLARASEQTHRLAEAASNSAMASEQIAASSLQQAAATAQISDAVRDIDAVAGQNVEAARQLEGAAKTLADLAADLKALVGSA